MINVEIQGVPCVFNEDPVDDFELLEVLAEIEEGNILKLPQFFIAVFGEEQFANIKESLRGDDGVCRLTDMASFYRETMSAVASAKRADAKTNLPCHRTKGIPGAGARRPSTLLRPEPGPPWR